MTINLNEFFKRGIDYTIYTYFFDSFSSRDSYIVLINKIDIIRRYAI